MAIDEEIEMLEILKEQSIKSCKDTAILDVSLDSFVFTIDEAIKLLKREPDTLNKIRAEIEDTGAYEQEVNGKTEFVKGITYCLNIIDKYKEENKECEYGISFGSFDENAADIKLAITIPKEIYEASQIIDVKYEDVIQIPLEVIKNGTPFPNSCTGHLIFKKTIFDKHGCTAECSNCRKKWKTYDTIGFEKEYNYCPNCGAKLGNAIYQGFDIKEESEEEANE